MYVKIELLILYVNRLKCIVEQIETSAVISYFTFHFILTKSSSSISIFLSNCDIVRNYYIPRGAIIIVRTSNRCRLKVLTTSRRLNKRYRRIVK